MAVRSLACGKRFTVDGKTISGQERYFDNKSSQPAAVADQRRQEVKVGSKSYEAQAKKFDTKVPGATAFQDKLKEYELKATVGMFGEISKDGESILELAAWKRAAEYCTFASESQVALSRIKQQMHREVGHSNMLQIVRNIRDNMAFLELGEMQRPVTFLCVCVCVCFELAKTRVKSNRPRGGNQPQRTWVLDGNNSENPGPPA